MNPVTRHTIPRGTMLLLVGLLLITQRAVAVPAAEPLQPEAAAQPQISYQGTLTDPDGNPINATVTMKFALYDAPSGGNLKWGSETQSVQVANGLFHVLLGSVTPIDPANLAGDLWLDIEVNGEQLTPRERIGSVLRAAEAAIVPDGSITTAKLNINANVDMQGQALLNTDSVAARSSGPFSLLYMQDNDLFLKPGAATGSVYIGRWGGAIPLWVSGDGTFAGNLYSASNLTVNGLGFFGGATYWEGAVNIQSVAVPLTFKESDQSGSGSLWRMPLDGTRLRFDSSDNGVDFTSYHTPFSLYNDGSVGCGAITENNLQTEEERAAGRSDRFEEGDLLCWSAKEQRLEKCAMPNDPLVQAVADKSGRPIVIGAEVVKVTGTVRAGDYLVASGVPGYAMASPNPTFGIVIAQALEDFDGEQGAIKAMIRKM